jgi:6-phosphogluconolactonase (cycloisomerase 2 family)
MHAYVGSRTTRERQARGRGIEVYAVDAALEHWTPLQTVEAVNPSFLALAADGRSLYAVHGDGSEVSSFRVAGDGRLEVLNRRSTGGRNPVHLGTSEDGRHLAVADYASGSLASLPVRPDGSLGEVVDRLLIDAPPGPHRIEQAGPHPHQVPRWPGSDLFVVPDKGSDRVHLVRLQPDGRWQHEASVAMRSVSGPRHAAFDAARGWVWIVNELDSTVVACRLDAQAAWLEPFAIASTLPSRFVGESRAAAIAADPSSGTVYVSNRGHDSVCVLSADPSGELRARQWAPSGGTTPRFITLAPDCRSLLVANETSDSLARFAVGPDGSLAGGRIVAATGSPVCVVFGPDAPAP